METTISAKLILRTEAGRVKPIIKVEVAGERFVLYMDPKTTVNYDSLLRKLAMTFGSAHSGHKQSDS